jgi:hypothetical protein
MLPTPNPPFSQLGKVVLLLNIAIRDCLAEWPVLSLRNKETNEYEQSYSNGGVQKTEKIMTDQKNRQPKQAPHPEGSTHREVPVKQGGRSRITVWVLLFSILLAIIIGGVLLSNTDELQQNTTQSAPSNSASDTPSQARPQNNQGN